MLKLLIGPVLVGGGYCIGSYYGADAEQLVHKDPSHTYGAVDQVLGNIEPSGTTFFEGGTRVPYAIKVNRTPGEKLAITLLFADKKGVAADVTFVPENDGHDTLIRAQIHADRTVLRAVLAGTKNARLAYAPDWMLNLAFKPLLKQLASQIEQGEIARVVPVDPGEAEARWEANLSEKERGELAQSRQYQATQPAIDLGATGNSLDRK